MTDFVDTFGRTLADYPRPSVAVDTAVLTVLEGRLAVLLVAGESSPRLPGTFLHEGEILSDAVLRSLHVKAGVEGLSPTQLHVFDDPKRDERGWVLSITHVDVVPATQLSDRNGTSMLVAVDDLPQLPWGHEQIVEEAATTLRAEYRATPDPRSLLGDRFTLKELQEIHEAVEGTPLPRDTFRRGMQERLVATAELRIGTVGKPARVFERATS
jgi:8-oxo-dGTP diphosphatase